MGKSEVNRHYLIDKKDIIHAKNIGITFGTHIGKGSFADVYYAFYKSTKVALKATHRNKCSEKTFDSEMKVINALKVSLEIIFTIGLLIDWYLFARLYLMRI